MLVNIPKYLNRDLLLLVEEGRYAFCLSELQVRKIREEVCLVIIVDVVGYNAVVLDRVEALVRDCLEEPLFVNPAGLHSV